MADLRKGELRNGTRLEEHGPAVCPNGHAMDEGYFNCPCCGAYRPSIGQLEQDAEAVKMMRRMGIPAAEVAEWLADAQRRRRGLS